MAGTGVEEPVKLKVFISYSRKDEDFAQELLGALEIMGFEPYLDKHDIAAGEDWEVRLGRLIEAADTVVFVISPDAVASERCAWEVERTVTLKKRLLPIVFRRVEEAQVPTHLKQLNYIFFDRPLNFIPPLKALTTALKTDIAWIREHTRLGEAALRWDARGRAEALLLRGEELAAAKSWLGAQPQFAPEPTLLHHEFIKAGEDAEAARSSAERQRLDQMAAAQAEREKALERERAAQEEREKALERERTALRRGRRALAVATGLFRHHHHWCDRTVLPGLPQRAIPMARSDAPVRAHGRAGEGDSSEARLRLQGVRQWLPDDDRGAGRKVHDGFTGE
jgi:TIR domain